MRSLRARQIVDAIADAASRWQNADFSARVRTTAAIVERTGYTEPVVDYALDRLFEAIGRDALQNIIADELGSLAALDGFVPRAGRPDVWFCGVDEVALIASDTTIGVAIPALVFALCAKARVIVKDRDDALARAFVATLAEERPEFGAAVEIATWRGDDPAERSRLAHAATVVAYGRDETLARIRASLAPQTRFVGFGHRTSVGYVSRETFRDAALTRRAAAGAARDALLYDGDGCLSLHALFVESGGALEPRAFARLVAAECDAVAVEFPADYAQPDPAVAAYHRSASFRAAQGTGYASTAVLAPHLVVLDPPRDDPPPMLRRTLALYSVDAPADAAHFIRRHALPLEAIALADPPREAREDVLAFVRNSGAARIAELGTLQAPPLGGEHGGVGRILPFVRAIYCG